MKFLIDECLHTSLVEIAHERGFEAHHVVYYGLQGAKDHELMRHVREEDFVFVTNNELHFRKLFGREPLHAGLVIIVPSVSPEIQRQLFKSVLEEIAGDEPVNMIVLVRLERGQVVIEMFPLFRKS